MFKRLLAKLSSKQHLSENESYNLLKAFASGEATDSQIAALLVALKFNGEAVEELVGLARAMKDNATKIDYIKHPIYDCCGTGGDMASTINVSTAAGILASACDVYVAKHSNKSITSQSGSSDVLQELGITLCTDPVQVTENLDENNIAFIHAPSFHKSTKNIAKIRKEIGIRTVFNLLGPLTNPASPSGQLIGVSSPELCEIICQTLRSFEMKRAMVVCALMPRLDELSICGPSLVYELNDAKITSYELAPEELGLTKAPITEIKGGDPKANAQVIKDIFETRITDARRDIVVLNTAALLWIADKVESLKEGINVATMCLFTGKANEKLLSLQKK